MGVDIIYDILGGLVAVDENSSDEQGRDQKPPLSATTEA